MSTSHITNQDISAKVELEPVLLDLLNVIQQGDSLKYKEMTNDNLTCFEPGTQDLPVEGLPFHNLWLNEIPSNEPYHIEIINPTYRIIGNVGYAAYSLIVGRVVDGIPQARKSTETRIFEKNSGKWKMIHFHRS